MAIFCGEDGYLNLSLSLSLSLLQKHTLFYQTHTQSPSSVYYSLYLLHTHRNKYVHAHTLFFLTHTHIPSLSLTLISQTLFFTHTHNFSFSPPPSLTHTSIILSLFSHSHAHWLKQTLLHISCPRLPERISSSAQFLPPSKKKFAPHSLSPSKIKPKFLLMISKAFVHNNVSYTI